MEHGTSTPNERVWRITQLAKLSFKHLSVVLTAPIFICFWIIYNGGFAAAGWRPLGCRKWDTAVLAAKGYIELGRLRLKTSSKLHISFAKTTWPTYPYLNLYNSGKKHAFRKTLYLPNHICYASAVYLRGKVGLTVIFLGSPTNSFDAFLLKNVRVLPTWKTYELWCDRCCLTLNIATMLTTHIPTDASN